MNKIIYTIIGLLALSSVVYAQTPGGINAYQGGTGYTSIPQYGWLSGGGTGALRLVSSTSPTVGYLTATSTATSTFSGNLYTKNLTVGVATTSTTDISYSSFWGDVYLNNANLRAILDNKGQAGSLYFDGFTTSARGYYTLNNSIGTSSVTLTARFRVPESGIIGNSSVFQLSNSNSAGASAGGFGILFPTPATDLGIRLFSTTTTGNFIGRNYTDWVTRNAGKTVDIAIVRDYANNDVYLYTNGVLETVRTVLNGGTAPTWQEPITSNFVMFGARSASAVYNDRIYNVRVWNRALSQNEIRKLSETGVMFADQSGSLTVQTSGTLTRGKRYRIQDYVAGDDFTNIGASSNASGVEFVTTGTTPTTWTNGSNLYQIGAVLDASFENVNPAQSTTIIENSSNRFTGTLTATGVTQVKPTNQIGNLFFGSTGNVGIGTTTPISALQVTDATNGSTITYGGKGTIVSGDTIGALDTYSNDASVGLTGVVSRIKTLAEADFISSQAKTSLVFQTNTGVAGTLGEVMRLTSAGLVGIGTTTPEATLDIHRTTGSGTAGTNLLLGMGASGGNSWGVRFNADNSALALDRNYGTWSNVMTWDRIDGDVGIASSTPYAKLSVTNTGSAPSFIVEDSTSPDATPFIIDASGNVGIGTTSPQTSLQVNSAATSTISATVVSGSTRSTTLGGRIILQDVAGGTCTEITTQSGVITSKAVACP